MGLKHDTENSFDTYGVTLDRSELSLSIRCNAHTGTLQVP